MRRITALYPNNKLFSECRIIGKVDPFIDNIVYNSKLATKNSVFIAVKGLNVDGHTFIEEAINKGSVAIIHSSPLKFYNSDVLYLQHPNPKRLGSLIASLLAEKRPQTIIGVTGTDGKTSTTDFLYQIVNKCGINCALLTTVEIDEGNGKKNNNFSQTTPEAVDIFNFLKNSKSNKIDAVVLEASSHGLSFDNSRLIDVPFSGAIYTNISSEHLDFHKTIENYVDSKLNLARQVVKGGFVVIPSDFTYTNELKSTLDNSVSLYKYSLDSDTDDSYLIANTLKEGFGFREISISIPSENQSFNTVLSYGQKVYAQNFIGSLLACRLQFKIPWEIIREKSSSIKKVRGRFEIIKEVGFPTIVVDFAHTSVAFEEIFSHTRKYFQNSRIRAVFSAAGQRDRSKRPSMGFIAASWCDYIYLSDEDPRSEDPNQIFSDIEKGISLANSGCVIFKIHDRREAIKRAIAESSDEDVLLLLSKGHEQSIHYDGYDLEWDEKKVVKEILNAWGKQNGR